MENEVTLFKEGDIVYLIHKGKIPSEAYNFSKLDNLSFKKPYKVIKSISCEDKKQLLTLDGCNYLHSNEKFSHSPLKSEYEGNILDVFNKEYQSKLCEEFALILYHSHWEEVEKEVAEEATNQKFPF